MSRMPSRQRCYRLCSSHQSRTGAHGWARLTSEFPDTSDELNETTVAESTADDDVRRGDCASKSGVSGLMRRNDTNTYSTLR